MNSGSVGGGKVRLRLSLLGGRRHEAVITRSMISGRFRHQRPRRSLHLFRPFGPYFFCVTQVIRDIRKATRLCCVLGVAAVTEHSRQSSANLFPAFTVICSTPLRLGPVRKAAIKSGESPSNEPLSRPRVQPPRVPRLQDTGDQAVHRRTRYVACSRQSPGLIGPTRCALHFARHCAETRQ